MAAAERLSRMDMAGAGACGGLASGHCTACVPWVEPALGRSYYWRPARSTGGGGDRWPVNYWGYDDGYGLGEGVTQAGDFVSSAGVCPPCARGVACGARATIILLLKPEIWHGLRQKSGIILAHRHRGRCRSKSMGSATGTSCKHTKFFIHRRINTSSATVYKMIEDRAACKQRDLLDQFLILYTRVPLLYMYLILKVCPFHVYVRTNQGSN
jgi:hypothetical protein